MTDKHTNKPKGKRKAQSINLGVGIGGIGRGRAIFDDVLKRGIYS